MAATRRLVRVDHVCGGNYGEVGAPGGTVRVFESRDVRVRGTARATSYVHVLSAGTGIVDLPTHRTCVESSCEFTTAVYQSNRPAPGLHVVFFFN